jgi:formate dehydrogenase major subunit
MPSHYEPHESPVANVVHPSQRVDPASVWPDRPDNPRHPPDGPVFPYVLTTYRLTEHHTAGGMSRTVAYLNELQPEMFCEVSPELAAERGLEHGGWATIVTARSAVEARVLVTERVRPLVSAGRVVHQVGLPYHWGRGGLTSSDGANELLAIIMDNNVHITEYKAATCDIRPGRRPRGRGLTELVAGYRRRAGIAP